MSKSAKLIPLPAASASATALTINQRATDKELANLGHALARIEGSRSWWLGDYGLELQTRKAIRAKVADSALTDDDLKAHGRHYMGERAEALGIDAGNWWNCVMVARYYEPSLRTEVSFTHHYIAMLAAGGAGSDPKAALAWLAQAREHAWTVSQFRHQVNLSLRTGDIPSAPPETNPFAPVDEADQWAIKHHDAKLEPESAKAYLIRWAALLQFIDRLKAIAAGGQ